MVSDGTQYFQDWWMGTFPGLAIFTSVLALNFLGDSLRDALDPRRYLDAREADDDEPARGRGPARDTARRRAAPVTVVDGVDFAVEEGQVFGLAGESGSGKTMSALALLGLLPPRRTASRAGSCTRAVTWSASRERELQAVRGREIAMVFQDPMTSLHPMLTIGQALTEHLRQHLKLSQADARPARGRAAGRGADPGPRGLPEGLPASVLRRHAPAHRDRHRADLRPSC